MIDAALDLPWVRSELARHYSSLGCPSIDPEPMIRMLVVGYVFAIRSERLLCREVQVNRKRGLQATSLSAGAAGYAQGSRSSIWLLG